MSRNWMNRLNPPHESRSGIQIITAPMSSVMTHVTMLASANHAGRRCARLASMIATPAKAARSRIVRKARPMMPFCVPTSTQMTHTIAAAMSAPIATQIAARTSGDLDESALAGSAWWVGRGHGVPLICGSPRTRPS